MIGKIFVKGAFDDGVYSEAASWCNASGKATIEDKGEYYEIVALPEQSFEEIKSEKLSEINARCDAILDSAVSSYPQSEVLTFDQQVEEVRLYQQSGHPGSAPLLSALATARGISLDELCIRVLTKRAQFSTLSGVVIGQRQRQNDKIGFLQQRLNGIAVVGAVFL